MEKRVATGAAWTVVAICIAVIGYGIALAAQARALRPNMLEMGIAFVMYPIVGAVIVARRPRNVIGRLLVAMGLGTATTFLSGGYLTYTTAAAGSPAPGASLVDWMGNVVWPVNLGLGVLLVLLYPTGKLPSTRWRWPFWIGVTGILLNVVATAFMPGQFSGETTSNPFGVEALRPALTALSALAGLLFAVLIGAAALAVIWRFWRSRGIERQQMKWFAFGTAMLLLGGLTNAIWFPDSSLGFALGFGVLPFSIGVAVLRYQLYDIDIIINRALVYGSLTATLATVYFGAVLGSQALTQRFTGQSYGQQPIVIVLTTLVIAALFQPLRRRFQRTIDRRFYRAKYDSARTIAQFSQSLRAEVEIERLCERLVLAVEDTMRPAHVSLWLRDSPGERLPRASAPSGTRGG